MLSFLRRYWPLIPVAAVFAVAVFLEWSHKNTPQPPLYAGAAHAGAAHVPALAASQPLIPSAAKVTQQQQQNAAPKPNVSGDNNAGPNNDAASPNLTVSPKISVKTGNSAKDDEQKSSADWWLVAVTVGLLLAAFLTYFTLRKQANIMEGTLKQMREDAKLARDEFISTHRPKIIVQSITLPLDIQSVQIGMVVGAFVIYFNKGATVAKDIEIRAKLTRSNFPIQSGMFIHDKIEPHAGELKGGEKDYFRLRCDHLVSSERILQESRQLPEVAVICMGTIRYKDDLGTQRETGFCHRFNAVTERWVSAENSEYEYAY